MFVERSKLLNLFCHTLNKLAFQEVEPELSTLHAVVKCGERLSAWTAGRPTLAMNEQ
jgi:hypothetical protein